MAKQNLITKESDAMYHLFVVAPIEEIVKNLEGGVKYRLEFLDSKLQSYMKTAACSLGYSANFVCGNNKPETWNEYAKDYYLNYFKKMLKYFHSH